MFTVFQVREQNCSWVPSATLHSPFSHSKAIIRTSASLCSINECTWIVHIQLVCNRINWEWDANSKHHRCLMWLLPLSSLISTQLEPLNHPAQLLDAAKCFHKPSSSQALIFILGTQPCDLYRVCCIGHLQEQRTSCSIKFRALCSQALGSKNEVLDVSNTSHPNWNFLLIVKNGWTQEDYGISCQMQAIAVFYTGICWELGFLCTAMWSMFVLHFSSVLPFRA